jgi:hypothetical protein
MHIASIDSSKTRAPEAKQYNGDLPPTLLTNGDGGPGAQAGIVDFTLIRLPPGKTRSVTAPPG